MPSAPAYLPKDTVSHLITYATGLNGTTRVTLKMLLSARHKSRGHVLNHVRMQKNKALVDLGKQIRKIRQRKNLSQENAALEAGLDRAYYGRIERGEVNVAVLNLTKIARALNVTVREFFPKRPERHQCQG